AARLVALVEDQLALSREVLVERYRLQHELGRGGIATVYLSSDMKHGRDVDVMVMLPIVFFFFQAEDGIRDYKVTGVQTCALPISPLPVNGYRVDDRIFPMLWRW